ncbi:uncharacterized protein LOC127264830 [Andrographis paniculata]|uniref:uncharacterized protein LOC127264830 n=1 Tax=Andrographis paniculata TaxID=175694 RepID=UPI0021E891BF|nr:uncharacterized protein LOC127264830 [Andrographis paniculata]
MLVRQSHEAWSTLTASYKGDDKIKRVHLQTLRRQYELMEMQSTEAIDAYINHVIALANNMKVNGEAISKQGKVEKILRTLTSRFKHVVTAIEEAHDVTELTGKLLSSSLKAHEQRMDNNKVKTPAEKVLQAQTSFGDSGWKLGNIHNRGRGRRGYYSNQGQRDLRVRTKLYMKKKTSVKLKVVMPL